MSLPTTSALKWLPSAALGTSVTPNGTAWVNSTWGQISASMSADSVLAYINVNAGVGAVEYEVDIGIGASGSEQVIATYKSVNKSLAGSSVQPLAVPIDLIPSGSRVAVRMRKAGTNTTAWRFSIGYYESYSSTHSIEAAQKATPTGAVGLNITPSGSAWGNSTYTQLIASTNLDVLITSIMVNPAVAVEFELDIATGAASSEVVKATIPGHMESAAGYLELRLPVPLRITSGSRVAMRLRKSGTSTTAWQTALNYVEIPNDPPTIALNSPADAATTSDTTPTLEFTGSDAESNDLSYEVQIDTANTFDSQGSTATIFSDTFTDSNKNLDLHTPDTGTSWTELWATTAGVGYNIGTNRAQQDSSSSSGAIYTANATYGFADYYIQCTMVSLDASTDEGIYLFVRIQDQENMYAVRILDQNGTNTCRLYKKVSGTWTALGSAFNPPADGSVIKLEIIGTSLKFYDDGVEVASATDSDITVAGKAGIGGGGGTELVTSANNLSNSNILDDLTVVNAVPVTPLLDKLSASDTGFANTVTGGDTDPFNAGEKISYTVQGGDALAADTYYWRARVKDPSGSNTWSSWATTRSFEVTSGTVVDLVVQDAAHGHTVDSVTLTQDHNLTVADSLHTHTVDSPTLTQDHNLAVQDSTHAHSSDNAVLTQEHNLTVQDASHSHTAESPTLTTATVLDVQDSVHGHTVDSPTLTQDHNLAVQDATHAHTSDSVALTQLHELVVQDASHAHGVDNVSLTQAHLLAVDDSFHAHTVDSPTLTQDHNLVVQDSSHSHTVDNLALTQNHNLTVADALHSHTVENVDLTEGKTLVVQDSTHGHAVDNLSLTQNHNLTVQDSLHAHSVESPTLVVTYILVVQDATHAHTSESPTLELLAVTLVVQDSVHAHTAESVVLTQIIIPRMYLTVFLQNLIMAAEMQRSISLAASLLAPSPVEPLESIDIQVQLENSSLTIELENAIMNASMNAMPVLIASLEE